MDNGENSYRSFLAGDNEGLLEIVDEYQTGLMLYLNSFVQNIHMAEELSEDTFYELMIKRPQFSGKSSFKTWLFTIGKNISLNYIKRKKRHSEVSIDDFYGEEFLAKYIVNGEFLRDIVVSDMAEITTKENNSGIKTTAEDINGYMRSNGISGSTHVHEDDGVEKIIITYDGFFEKIKAYVVDTGVDESLVVYQQSHDDAIISNTSDNDKNEEGNNLNVPNYLYAIS